jgi:hypothetical protein
MRLAISAVLVGLLLCAPLLEAHHSHGNYDLTDYVFLEGTVTEVHWINPHTWIYLEVAADAGETALWALEGANISRLEQLGWTRDSIKVGDRLSARCHQLRDGTNGCLLGYLTTEGGEERVFD